MCIKTWSLGSLRFLKHPCHLRWLMTLSPLSTFHLQSVSIAPGLENIAYLWLCSNPWQCSVFLLLLYLLFHTRLYHFHPKSCFTLLILSAAAFWWIISSVLALHSYSDCFHGLRQLFVFNHVCLNFPRRLVLGSCFNFRGPQLLDSCLNFSGPQVLGICFNFLELFMFVRCFNFPVPQVLGSCLNYQSPLVLRSCFNFPGPQMLGSCLNFSRPLMLGGCLNFSGPQVLGSCFNFLGLQNLGSSLNFPELKQLLYFW